MQKKNRKGALWVTAFPGQRLRQDEQAKKFIRRVSKAMAKKLVIYRKLRAEFLKANPICQICHKRPSTEPHHRSGRIGTLLNDTTTWIATCRPCHNLVHNEVGNALALGLIASWGVKR